ncbi:MAG: peptidase, partial [Chitinophagaceae bacterium]|nr:peptidase [Chitinophagaceae bacterium]
MKTRVSFQLLLLRNKAFIFLISSVCSYGVLNAQSSDAVIDNIVKEANNNSQLQKLAHELFDMIGPRLVGTPQMQKANEWALSKYAGWGINAHNEQ